MWYSLKYSSECAHVLNLSAKVQDLSSDCCRFADVPCTQNMDQLPFYCSIETVTTESPPTRTQRLGSAAEPPSKWSRYFPCKQIFSAIVKAAVRAGARYGQARGWAAQQKWFVIAQLMLKIKGTKSSLGGVWHLCSCKTALLWNTAESFTVLRGTSERRAEPGGSWCIDIRDIPCSQTCHGFVGALKTLITDLFVEF